MLRQFAALSAIVTVETARIKVLQYCYYDYYENVLLRTSAEMKPMRTRKKGNTFGSIYDAHIIIMINTNVRIGKANCQNTFCDAKRIF